MQFNLYIGNHGKRDGIEDFIEIISNILVRRGHFVLVSQELSTELPNIIIDEFTNIISNRKIAALKYNYPNAKLIYVLTEFIEKKYGLTSFNLFEGIGKVSVLTLINIYIKLKRSDFPSPTLYDFILAFFHLPFYIAFFAIYFVKKFVYRKKCAPLSSILHRPIYLLMRFHGMSSMLKHADLIVLAHQDIAKNLNDDLINSPTFAGLIYPEMDIAKIQKNLFDKKVLAMELTGSVTPYRQKWIDKINNVIMMLGVKHDVGMSQVYSFSNTKSKTVRAAFSLHPPQSKHWKYSSPTRLFRALDQEGNIPVITHYFNQHPIEDVCLLYEGGQTILDMYDFYHDKNKAWAFLLPRLQRYAKDAELENNKLVQKMISLHTQAAIKI